MNIMITKLAPSVRLPYKQIRGSLEQRQQTAIGLVDKLYRDLYPKFNKNNELSLTEIQKSIDDIFEKKVKIIVKKILLLNLTVVVMLYAPQ